MTTNRTLLLLGCPELPGLAFQGEARSRAPRTLEGGGGGGSSSSTSTTTQNVDRRQVVDGGSIGVTSDGGGLTINTSSSTLDGGAIGGAFDLAKVSTESWKHNVVEVLGFAKDVLKVAGDSIKTTQGAFDTAMKVAGDNIKTTMSMAGDNIKTTQGAFATATEKVSDAYNAVQEMSSGQKFMVAGGLALAGIVAIKAMGGRKGG